MSGEVVNVLRPTASAGRYGDEEFTYPSLEAPTFSLVGVAVEPVGAQEQTQGRNGTLDTLKLYIPQVVELFASDRLVVRGKAYEAQGNGEQWSNPLAPGLGGTTITVQRSEG